MYGVINSLPQAQRADRPCRVPTAAKEALLEYQRRMPWSYQVELAIFLEEEWGISVS